MFRFYFLTIVCASLVACGGGDDGGGGGGSAVAQESKLGDFCLANEPYYPLRDTSSVDESMALRVPRPGDNRRIIGEIEARTASETETRERDFTSTFYSISSPSDVVSGRSPPIRPSGYWTEWESGRLIRQGTESNIGGEGSSSVYLYSENNGRYSVVNSEGELYAHLVDDSFWVWGRPDIPLLIEFTSVSSAYKVFSSSYDVIRNGQSVTTVDTKRKIKTGIGCVESIKITTSLTEILESGGGISNFAADLYNTGEPEKTTFEIVSYVHPLLGIIKSEVLVALYQDDTDDSPVGRAAGVSLLIDTNIGYLLPAKTNKI